MEYVDLGRTGLRVSRLAIGTGTHGWGGRSEQTALGIEELARLLRSAYDHGITFWDAADGYGSHPHVARALRGIPRERVVIATKTQSHTARDVTADVERFLHELNTDVLDIVLLHCVSSARWPQQSAGAMEALGRAKEQGKVRAVGISCHALGALDTAAESDWTDVLLVRINYAGTNMDASPDQVRPSIQKAYDRGKGIYAMKVLGCGRLTKDVRRAVEYVLQLGTVHAMTIGTCRQEHLLENLAAVQEIAPGCPLRVSNGAKQGS